jgi:hypothetical protein
MQSKNNFSASRYITHSMLLTKEELLEFLPDGFYVILGKVCKKAVISKEEFIAIDHSLKKETVGFAYSLDHFSFLTIKDRGEIAAQCRPVIEIKPFSFLISFEQKILEGVYGTGSIDFGLSYSYPGLYSDGEKIVKTRGTFKEAELFDQFRVYKRENTVSAKFLLGSNSMIATFRIGKNAQGLAREKIPHYLELEVR